MNTYNEIIKKILSNIENLDIEAFDINVNLTELKNYIDNTLILEKKEYHRLMGNYEKLKEKYKVVQGFLSIIEAITSEKDVNSVINVFLDIIKKIITYEEYQFFLFNNEKNDYILFTKDNKDENLSNFVNSHIEEGIVDWVLENKKMTFIPLLEKENYNICYIPLTVTDKKIGFISLLTVLSKDEISKHHMDMIDILANQLSITVENSILYKDLVGKINTMEELFAFSDSLNSTLDMKLIAELVLNKLIKEISFDYCALFIKKEEELLLLSKVNEIEKIIGDKETFDNSSFLFDKMKQRNIFISYNANDDFRLKKYENEINLKDIESLCLFPLPHKDKEIGIIIGAAHSKIDYLASSDLALINNILKQTILSLENAILYSEMEKLTITDDLTKLYNNRYFYKIMENELNRAKRYKSHFSIMFMDMDGFKDVNDKHGGHLMGSEALKEVANIIRKSIRSTDVAARYGGDEFVVLFTETNHQNSLIVAERIRRNIENYNFLEHYGMKVKMTSSIGLASYPEHGEDIKTLVLKADNAMYKAKEVKNRVIVAD